MPKLKLTAAAVVRLPEPAEGQTDFFDAAYPGLALRVTAKGVRSWSYFARVHGKLRRVTLGRFPELGLAEARKAAAEAADRMRQGIDPTFEKNAQRIELDDSFEGVFEEWMKRDQAKNRSAAEVRRLVEREVLPAFGGRRLESIRRRDVIAVIDAVADRGAVTLARRLQAHLHRMFRWSVGRGLIEANPIADLPKPGTEVRRDRVLSDAEIVAVWHASGELGYPFGPIFRLLLLTGARRDEIGELEWSEIEGDTIRLRGSRTKNGEPHDIALSEPARAILEELPRIGNRYVFTTTGETAASGYSRAKQALDRRMAGQSAAMPEWRLHDLRRTLATGLQKLGTNLQTIEAVLGHVGGSRAGIVGVYQRHDFADETRRALSTWAKHIMALTGDKPSNVEDIARHRKSRAEKRG
jgi:integrase